MSPSDDDEKGDDGNSDAVVALVYGSTWPRKSNNVQNVPPVGAGEILGRLRRAEMARYIYSEIHLLYSTSTRDTSTRDTSTPRYIYS